MKPSLHIIRSLTELRAWRASLPAPLRIGFVPTMGALHEGHLSLVHQSKQLCDLTVASIFVNPLQFGPQEDLARYPRPFERDCALLAQAGCDLLFAPHAAEITPTDATTVVEETKVSAPLCGSFRPGHFRGVTTIVLKLLNLVRPQHAFFGQKDAQQVAVLERMVRDLCVPVSIHRGATLRESDGLALSSRNVYLSAEDREKAPLLAKALQEAAAAFAAGEARVAVLEAISRARLAQEPDFKLQYLEIRDRATLEALSIVDRPAVLCVAAFLGKTRLIDNLELFPTEATQ